MDFGQVACHREQAVHGQPFQSACPLVLMSTAACMYCQGQGLEPGHLRRLGSESAEAQRPTETIPAMDTEGLPGYKYSSSYLH